jgi:glycosyltransferase involved in cell wall biosynthesis
MHLLVDAVAVRAGSAAIVVEHLLLGWQAAAPSDRLTVLAPPDGAQFAVRDGVEVITAASPLPGAAGGIWQRSVAVRRTARAIGADAVLSGVPASGLLGTGCPRGLILYDLRHELRPAQFTRGQRWARRISWGWSMRRCDEIFTISERTRNDLRDRHPRHGAKATAAPLGSDHADAWPEGDRTGPPYAVAFGHFSNKNADAVIEAWQSFSAARPDWRLRLVGMGAADRAAAAQRVAALGIADHVELMPWLDDDEFVRTFTGADLVIFPSDFEGYGLPAAEAMRRGIPVVVSTDPALAEVTGGHAAVAASAAPDDLAAAMERALASTDADLEQARRHAEQFTWARTAVTIRDRLLGARPPSTTLNTSDSTR